MRIAIYSGLFIISLVALYVTCVAVGAWLETKAAPRSEMFFCSIHGFMKKEHTIKLIEWSDMPMCPRCFSASMKAAERSGKVQAKK